ncbi:EAL domain-containing protein [Desulfonatronovibrio magnus]|uniref:EAL domain-containing protein n=1 Tax=Desulfonatronovibrio magnus TaxID=698827 RepID=UPI000697137B|nr:EAL domain-containing protein [Desulfonatronovibrio magnus]
MKCICEKNPEIICGKGTLIFFCRAVDLLHHVRKHCEQKLLLWEDIPGGVIVRTLSTHDFLKTFCLSPEISDPEKQAIKFVFLEKGDRIDPAHLASIQSILNYARVLDAADLLEILEENRLTTFFQPIVDIRKQSIFGHECLLRGLGNKGEIISPGYLLNKARDSEILHRLDRQARETALTTAQNSKAMGHLFINFIPTTIYEPSNCLKKTFAVMKNLDIDPNRIVFEVVETESVRDTKHLKGILKYYKEQGMKTALDDMGSGYSSLRLLTEIMPDYIKIDAAIIRDIHQNTLKQSIFKALSNASSDNGIKVLAEGVETKDELDFILTCNVDLVQGYYFAKPQAEPVQKLRDFL